MLWRSQSLGDTWEVQQNATCCALRRERNSQVHEETTWAAETEMSQGDGGAEKCKVRERRETSGAEAAATTGSCSRLCRLPQKDGSTATGYHTKKLCSRLSSSEVWFGPENGRFAFLSPPLGAQGQCMMFIFGHWKVHNRLSVSINWTFSAGCYGWVATSENRPKISDFTPLWSVWPKFQVERVSTHQLFLHA